MRIKQLIFPEIDSCSNLLNVQMTERSSPFFPIGALWRFA
jgi:hypothetical protein